MLLPNKAAAIGPALRDNADSAARRQQLPFPVTRRPGYPELRQPGLLAGVRLGPGSRRQPRRHTS